MTPATPKRLRAPSRRYEWLNDKVDRLQRELIALRRETAQNVDLIGQLQEAYRELAGKVRRIEGSKAS